MSEKLSKAEKLLYAIGELDGDLIISAEELQGRLRPLPSRKRLERYGALAAGLLLCLGLWGFGRLVFAPAASAAPQASEPMYMNECAPAPTSEDCAPMEAEAPVEEPAAAAPMTEPTSADKPDKKQESAAAPAFGTTSNSAQETGGTTTLRAQNSSQLLSANPWKGQAQSLPVYSLGQQPTAEERLLTVAGQLGLEEDRLNLREQSDSAPQALWSAQTEAGELLAYADQIVVLRLEEPLSLSLPLNQEAAYSQQQLEPLAQELQSRYSALLPYEEPAWALEGLGVDGEQRPCWSIVFYEGSGSPEEQLLSYSCGAVRFLFDGEGALERLSSQETAVGESLYRRQLLPEEEAQARLDRAETVVQSQLRYRRSGDLLEPVYCFTLEGEPDEQGLYGYMVEETVALDAQ